MFGETLEPNKKDWSSVKLAFAANYKQPPLKQEQLTS